MIDLSFLIMILTVAAIAAVAIIIVVILLKNNAKTEVNEREWKEWERQGISSPMDAEEEETVLMQEDEEETILMNQTEDRAENFQPKRLIMQTEDGQVLLNTECSGEITIGRKSFCNVQITGDKSVSGVHCFVGCDAYGNPFIKDNSSSNGTFLNEQRIFEECLLQEGDTVQIGRTSYIVHVR